MNKRIKMLDKLWGDCIKARAGYESEVSGRTGIQIGGEYVLAPHHIYGKANHRLRYELSNGICLTNGEHNFNAHGSQDRQHTFRGKVEELRGSDIYERLRIIKLTGSTTDLSGVEIYLKQKLDEFKRGKT